MASALRGLRRLGPLGARCRLPLAPTRPLGARCRLPLAPARPLAAIAQPAPRRSPAWSARALSSGSAGERQRDAITTILAALEDGKVGCSDTFEPALGADGKLVLDLGSKGSYSLEAAAGGQLLLFSPVAGPKYYDYDEGEAMWRSPEDGHLMVELLVRELMHSTSVCINL